MRLNEQELNDILRSKGFTCLNLQEYKNLDTVLQFQCQNGHKVETNIRTMRDERFVCPICDGAASVSAKMSRVAPPKKNGYRIVAIDNATERAGVSVFDNGELVFFTLLRFEGDTIGRMLKNRSVLEDVIFKVWEPDLVVFEDIQYQTNVQTFKTLAMLLGNSLVSARKVGIKTETVLSKVWRSHFLISGKTRLEQKKQAIQKVKTMYGLDVNDDQAEAILIGKYAVDKVNRPAPKKLF